MIPSFFKAPYISDVTFEYINAFDLETQLDNINPKQRVIYLCVYNNKIWTPLQFSRIKDGKVMFPRMGTEIMYSLGSYNGSQISLISLPFIFLMKNGTVREISGSGEISNKKFSMTKISGYEYVKKGEKYNLYKRENNKWKYVNDFIAFEDSLLEFQGLNKNTLYQFQETSRPFTISDSLEIW